LSLSSEVKYDCMDDGIGLRQCTQQGLDVHA